MSCGLRNLISFSHCFSIRIYFCMYWKIDLFTKPFNYSPLLIIIGLIICFSAPHGTNCMWPLTFPFLSHHETIPAHTCYLCVQGVLFLLLSCDRDECESCPWQEEEGAAMATGSSWLLALTGLTHSSPSRSHLTLVHSYQFSDTDTTRWWAACVYVAT